MKNDLKKKAIELRLQRKSLKEIQTELNISKSTASVWLKEYPVHYTKQEISERHELVIERPKRKPVTSKFYHMIADKNSTTSNIGKIAEAAVIFRLTLLQYSVYSSIFEGDRFDLIVSKNSKLIKIQVKTASYRGRDYGFPSINLRCSDGRNNFKLYSENDFDIIIGYDLIEDIAYVYTYDDIKNHKSGFTVTTEAQENWSKLDILVK